MKRVTSVILLVTTIISCVICFTACQAKKDDRIDKVNAILANDVELNKMFSSVRVEVYSNVFSASLFFKNYTSDMVRKLSEEEACSISKMVHDKVKKAIIQSGYKKIHWIDASMYSSDFGKIENTYTLSFGMGAETKTWVSVWMDAYNPLFNVKVTWGGSREYGY